MSSCQQVTQLQQPNHQSYMVGVGLRHQHYREALLGTSAVDFVEVHAENFFADGGMARQLISDVAELYPISLHSTSMGLGSAAGVNHSYLQRLERLVQELKPILVSDHACFTWAEVGGRSAHAGDLLPIEFTQQSLKVMQENVDRVQQLLGRQILVENLSAYIEFEHSQMQETEFLTELVHNTGCGLLVDLNNLLVNGHNFGDGDALHRAKQWLSEIPAVAVGEIHLAGYQPVADGELIIDDHSRPVSDECWQLFRFAVAQFGAVTTLIEWDNELPTWRTLIGQAEQAKAIMVTECERGLAHVG